MVNLVDIHFSYRNGRTVFAGLNLSLTPGHIYGLFGRNGAGKSSLLYLLSGLSSPDTGTCRVMDQQPADRQVNFLQRVFLLPEELPVFQGSVDTYASLHAPFYPDFDNETFRKILEEFGVPPKLGLNRMSYGETKKAMIGFAIATRVPLLLLDEPTNGMDIPAKRQFRKIVAGYTTDDQAVIISTHQVKDLESLIDYVLVLDGGRMLVHESVDRITRKLVFGHHAGPGTPIYSEQGLRGRLSVAVNHSREESKLDMELFFNAVISHPEQIAPLFNP